MTVTEASPLVVAVHRIELSAGTLGHGVEKGRECGLRYDEGRWSCRATREGGGLKFEFLCGGMRLLICGRKIWGGVMALS